jgi:hypothetical protein
MTGVDLNPHQNGDITCQSLFFLFSPILCPFRASANPQLVSYLAILKETNRLEFELTTKCRYLPLFLSSPKFSLCRVLANSFYFGEGSNLVQGASSLVRTLASLETSPAQSPFSVFFRWIQHFELELSW